MSVVRSDGGAVESLAQRTPTALVLPDGLDFDTWLNLGRPLLWAGERYQWWIGDWLRYGEARYGTQYREAALVTRLDEGTLTNYRTVATAIPVERRREDLTWSHHREVVALEEPEQERLLEAAASSDWRVRELAAEVRALTGGSEPEPDVGNYSPRTSPATKVEFGVRVVVRGERAHADLLKASTAAADDQLREHAHEIATRLRTHLADAGVSAVVDVR